jgi:thiamine-monophosphate kinase
VRRPNSEVAAESGGNAHDQHRSVSNDGTDEFAVIGRLRALFESAARTPGGSGDVVPRPGESWIGDDAAVIDSDGRGRLLVSADLVVEGVHFDLRYGGLDDTGWKALMVAASDIAAMGARPAFALLSLAAPAGTDIDAFGAGVAQASAELGCPVVGGDLSLGPAVVASVTVAGFLPEDGRPPMLRSGAQPGDTLLVTGSLGASAAGLRLVRATDRGAISGMASAPEPRSAALIAAHLRPRALVDEGIAAREGGASAAIDLSDGLASDARRLADASEVGMVIDVVPIAPGATESEAVGGGEDYALLVAVSDPEPLRASFSASGLREPVVIGRCTDEPGRLLLRGEPLPSTGWHHRF